ncbi:MAG: NYN domain-containing protein [Syntrophales bacterium]|nr:NYN domain-containing protein [Syntrophales bacterium]
MHIIIDGYNLIRQSADLKRHERFSLEEGRRALLRLLLNYRRKRGHRITVVFDGWVGGAPEEERDRCGDMDILYSRRGEKADELIKRLLAAPAEETLVVTSDHGIANFARRRGIASLEASRFEEILLRGEQHPSGIEKGEDDEDNRRCKRKGPARRPSRQQKQLSRRLSKL